MRLGRTIKRASIIAIAGAATLALSGAPASAHVIIIDPPGSEEEPKGGWVGGPVLPIPYEQGDEHPGLDVGGPPDGRGFLPPSHSKGLNTACEALGENVVVTIQGPGPGCEHAPPPPESDD